MKLKVNLLTAFLATVASLAFTASADAFVLLSSDSVASATLLQSNGSNGYEAGNAQVGTGGSIGSRKNRATIIGFVLPTLAIGQTLDNATFAITRSGTTANGNLTVDLYGLATTTPGASSFLSAPTDPDAANILLQDTFADQTTPPATLLSEQINTTAFIASLYTGNTPNQSTVYFRLNPGEENPNFDISRTSFDNATASLTINVPEPASIALLGFGAIGFLSRRRRL